VIARRPTLTGLLWISPWIVGCAAFVVLPAAMSFWFSFTDYSLLESPVWVGAANYAELLSDHVWRRAVGNTLLYALLSVTLGNTLALVLALLLEGDDAIRRAARAAIFLPTLIPLIATSLVWTSMLGSEQGLVNRLLAGVGISGPDWLGDRDWALPAMVLMSLWQVGGAVVINVAALRQVPRPLREAALLDGAGAWSRLRHVILPTIAPALLFNVVTGLIWSMQIFAAPYIMTRGGPERATFFYTMHVYENTFVYGRMGYACAMAWIQLLIILLLTTAMMRLSRRFAGAPPAEAA